jgi:Fic family protein
LIVSFDTIMKPPYDLTPTILELIKSISEKIGEVQALTITKPPLHLRKENRIKTIQATLSIEGNSLTEDQVTALLNKNRVIGPKKDIIEVTNAIQAYDRILEFKSTSIKDFMHAHKILMKELLIDPGQYRQKNIGIAKGNQVAHVAPPPRLVPGLMKKLFIYLRDKTELNLIKSCVFHYELEFIHPFSDGNGRIGRMWQTLILLEEYPVFEYLPFETLISKSQKKYYQALAQSDRLGKSTPFIEYMLNIIDEALLMLLSTRQKKFTATDRMMHFIQSGPKDFTRSEYMKMFKTISTATASRDLKKGVEMGWLSKAGYQNKSRYKVKTSR